MWGHGSRGLFAGLLVAAALSAPVSAQLVNPAIGDRGELRAEQAQLFDELRRRPDDLDLMSEYARLSIQLEDYEAAISTLERMLIYRQDLPQVRRELGVAYFNIGSYEAARLYLSQVLDSEDLPPAVRANTEAYLAEIEQRTRINRITQAQAGVGIVFSTNANFGPEQIEVGDVVGQVTQGGAEESFGVRVFGNLVHDYDLQGTNSDFWRTELAGLGIRYFSAEEGNLEFVRLRTGPQLSLDDADFGPKIRPYAAIGHLSVADESLYLQGGFGIELRNPINAFLSAFGDFSVQYRDFTDNNRNDSDAMRATAQFGLAYIPARDLVLRGALIAEQELARDFENTNTEIGARFSAQYQYETGLSGIDSKWIAAGVLDFRGRFFPGDQVSLADGPRQDFDINAGLSHIFGITQNFALQADLTSILRESSNDTFDLNNVTLGFSALYRL
ncbi:MAG: tetratricopeptide repeat protein [Pseudomonadota bacterium]